MAKTYILGHHKPDTDAVVSALALAELYQQKTCFGYSNPQARVASPINGETEYLFHRFGLTPPAVIKAQDIKPEDKIILIDHNEVSQRLSDLNEKQIVEIVDHHKANLNLDRPIFMTFKPWGSSASIVYYLMQQNQVQPNKKLAGLMLAAILSDTVGFKSATTTSQDRDFAQALAQLAGIDQVENFILDIFKAKSNLAGLSASQLVTHDYKIFSFHGQRVFINQIETVDGTQFIQTHKRDMLVALKTLYQELNLDLVFMAVSDIMQVNTKLLLVSQKEIEVAEKAFGHQVKDHVLDIGPKLSRKKEITPAIEQAILKI